MFLQATGLLPLAVLSDTQDKTRTLRETAERIDGIENRREQSNVAASTAILAGLVLEKNVIEGLLRQEIMKESVIYQEIIAEGRQEGEAFLVLRLLRKRIGQISLDLENRIQSLGVEELEDLGEALLDFESRDDLLAWLNKKY